MAQASIILKQVINSFYLRTTIYRVFYFSNLISILLSKQTTIRQYLFKSSISSYLFSLITLAQIIIIFLACSNRLLYFSIYLAYSSIIIQRSLSIYSNSLQLRLLLSLIITIAALNQRLILASRYITTRLRVPKLLSTRQYTLYYLLYRYTLQSIYRSLLQQRLSLSLCCTRSIPSQQKV